MNTDFAKAFRVIRAAYGMQQAELALKIGISASQLSLIEKGKRQPSLKVVGGLASAVEAPISLITLLASDPGDIADEDISSLAAPLLRLLVNAPENPQRPLQLA